MKEPLTVLRISDWVSWSVAEVGYARGTAYMDHEIVVYERPSDVVLVLARNELRSDEDLSPVARFETSDRGWIWACEFCAARRKEEM